MRILRLALRMSVALVLLPLITLSQPVAPIVPVATTSAASWVCPVENRTTRPNNGGPPVATYSIAGVDLSHWDIGYTMAAVRAAGQSFVFYKATQGTYMIDPTYAKQAAAARSVGLKVGAYHFFDYRLDGVAQARFFVTAVKARGGFHGRLRPVVDVECLTAFGRPAPVKAVSRLRAFITEVARLVGVKPIIYTSIYEWHTVTGGSATFGDCALWSAEWARTAPLNLPPGWKAWSFWQYGNKQVGAIGHDGDVFVGSAAALARWVLR